MERRTPVWEAPDEIVELMGDVSGNELNGWGSSEVRQPTLVMWAHPATIAHGPVQERMTEEFMAHPQLRTVLRTDDRHEPAPVDPRRIDRTPAERLADITEFAMSEQGHSAELVAVVAARREWFFEGRESDLPWAILLAVAMDHGELATAPEYTSAMEVHRQYNGEPLRRGRWPTGSAAEDSKRSAMAAPARDPCRWSPRRSPPGSGSSASTARSSTANSGLRSGWRWC